MSSYIINTDIPFIESATEVKKLLKSGWELWYLHNSKYSGLPGKWQMRHRDLIKPVSWDAIVKLRRNM